MFDLAEIPAWAWVLVIILCIILALCVARMVHTGYTGGGLTDIVSYIKSLFKSWEAPRILRSMKRHDLNEAENLYNVKENDKLDADGNGVLHLAAKVGHVDIIDALMKRIKTVDLNNKGQQPLHIAAENNNAEAFEALIRRDILPFYKDKNGKLPWECARNESLKSKFQKLSDDTIKDMIRKNSAKALAVCKEPDIQEQLDTFLVDLRNVDMTRINGKYNIIHFAIEYNIKVLCLALAFASACIDAPSKENHNVIWYAVRGSTLQECINYINDNNLTTQLIENEKNIIFGTIEYKNESAFRFIRNKFPKLMEAKLNGQKYTHYMVEKASKEFIEKYMPMDWNTLTEKDDHGKTPLYYAFKSKEEIVEMFYKKLRTDMSIGEFGLHTKVAKRGISLIMDMIESYPGDENINSIIYRLLDIDNNLWLKELIEKVTPENIEKYSPYIEKVIRSFESRTFAHKDDAVEMHDLFNQVKTCYEHISSILKYLLENKHLRKLYLMLSNIKFDAKIWGKWEKLTMFDSISFGVDTHFHNAKHHFQKEVNEALGDKKDHIAEKGPTAYKMVRAKAQELLAEDITPYEKDIYCVGLALYMGLVPYIYKTHIMPKNELCKLIIKTVDEREAIFNKKLEQIHRYGRILEGGPLTFP